MSYPKFGDYEAIVTDNSEFYKRGYIRVRVSAFYNAEVSKDLSQYYNESVFKSSLKDDLKCLVSMPLGGGNGHGIFTLPQVNSIGFVSFLNGDMNRALWKGSFVNPKYDNDGKFLDANVPNDKIEYEGAGSNGLTVDGKQVDVDGGAVIIRQKSTSSETPEQMNWDNNRTENLIVLDKNRASLKHVSEWEKKEEQIIPKKYHEVSITTDTDENSYTFGKTKINIKTVKVVDSGKVSEYSLEVDGEKVKLNVVDLEKQVENSISVSNIGVEVNALDTNTKKSTYALIAPDEITLTNVESNIILNKKEINLSTKKMITLSADEVRLGGLSQEYVVTASVPFSYRMEDGTVLGATRRVKA